MTRRRGWLGNAGAALAAVVTVGLIGGCGGTAVHRSPEVRPLAKGDSDPPTTVATSPAPTTAPSADADTATPTATPSPPAPDAHPRREVSDLLATYDRALTDLAAHPEAATDPAHPLTVAWHRVVSAGSALDNELLSRIAVDGRDNHMVVRPDDSGLSFHTSALRVSDEADGTVAFTHCGYSPGVGVDATTGAVLDDRRASARGQGRTHRGADGALVMLELRDESLVLLAAGEPDPCPELVATARAEPEPGR